MASGEPENRKVPSQSDRRPVTILFTDIVGSTSIAERLDPEEWCDVVAGAHARVSEAIVRYEGTIAQLLGDGVLAYFGAPAVHEDDPARAVQAALDIQAVVADYSHELGGYVDKFAMRIGIHTGEVVAGAVSGAGHVEYLAIGDAVNLAARLQSAAAPGRVLISASTARQVRGRFELVSLGEIRVTGKEVPVAVYEVSGARAGAGRRRGSSASLGVLGEDARTRGRGPVAALPFAPLRDDIGVLREDAGTRGQQDVGGLRAWPLVGRAAELAVLTDALEGLCQGRGAIVAILGEAGIGKSRLVEEARGWANGPGAAEAKLGQPPRWLEGRALSYGAGLSYWTIIQLLKADLGLADGDAEVRARVALRQRLNELSWRGTEGAEVALYLAHLLGLRPEGEAAERLAALDSETLKYQLLVSIRRYFQALAEQQPLVLACEDLHWADPSTLDALGELLSLTDQVPLLLLLIMRAEREHGAWQLKRQAETGYAQRYYEIALRPLSEGHAEQLVNNLLIGETADPPAVPAAQAPLPLITPDIIPDGSESRSMPNGVEGRCRTSAPLPDALRRVLLERAEGNPFFLEELVASLLEQGALVREGGAWHVQGAIESLGIPDTVQGVIIARIDRLDEDVRLTLQMASVIGRSFLYRLLQAIAEAEREIDRHLAVLQRVDLVREKAVRPQLEYIFKHSLAQEATYQTLLLKRRREFHRRVGEAMEQLYAGREEEIYGLLAHHFDQASSPHQTPPAERTLSAAQTSLAAQLERAAERAVHYLMAAGDKARMEDALAEAAGFYRRAVERLESMGDADRAARAWLKLALVYQADFDHAAAHEAYEQAFALEQQARDQAPTSPDEGAVLRRGGAISVYRLDPGKLNSFPEGLLANQLFAGLAQIDAELNVVPHAARSWEALDEGRCFRIYLRDDVRWTDGSSVTAHDYVYAWLRNLDPRVAGEDFPACMLDDVVGARACRLGQSRDSAGVGVRALDDLTLEVRLEQPVAYFPYLLGETVTFPLPRRTVERWGDAWWQPEHIVSNGPFRLVHFEQEYVILERSPLYFGGRNGNLARMEHVVIFDDAERLAGFWRGDLDQADLVGETANFGSFRQDLVELYQWSYLLLPMPPLDDVRVRRAIAMGVNWRSLVEPLGGWPATGGLVPPGMPGHTPGLALPYDPEQARRLLGEAGYPGGCGLPPLGVACYSRQLGDLVVRLVREELSVEVEFRWLPRFDWPKDVGNMRLMSNPWVADLPDPDSFLRQSNTLPHLRSAGWEDPELDALLERAAHTTDRAARIALYRQADRRLVLEQALVVPIQYAGFRVLNQPWVGGTRANKMGQLSMKDVVIERRVKNEE